MELTAAIEALKMREDGESVELCTDSEYLRLGITQWMDTWQRNGWTRSKGQPVLNKDLWLELQTQNERLQVEWRWVKAHAGHEFNELVDRAARDAATLAAKHQEPRTLTCDTTATSVESPMLGTHYFIASATTEGNRSAWAVIRNSSRNEIVLDGIKNNTSVNRALLIGVVELLQVIQGGESTHVTTESDYLFKGATLWLDGWRRRGWRKSDGKPVANKDLWTEIHALLNRVDVEWHLERHSDIPDVDSFVRNAAAAARDVLAQSEP